MLNPGRELSAYECSYRTIPIQDYPTSISTYVSVPPVRLLHPSSSLRNLNAGPAAELLGTSGSNTPKETYGLALHNSHKCLGTFDTA